MYSQDRIRLIVAEDQDLVRRAIAITLSFAADIVCLGEARNGDEAVKLAAELNPEIVLMDLHMPVKGGVAATREIRLRHPSIQVLVLTTLSDDETVFEAILAGAQGYLLKDVDDLELLESIRALHRHESALTPPLARRILERFQRDERKLHGRDLPAYAAAAAGPTHPQTLSGYEARLLALLAEGRSDAQVSTALDCSESAFKSHLSRVMAKLHANSDIEHAFRPSGDRSIGHGSPQADEAGGKR
jgi:DNA-binding NarL/FixJ family response regulator